MLDYSELYDNTFIFGHAHPGHEPTQQVIKTADQDIKEFIESLVEREEPFFLFFGGDHGLRIAEPGKFAGDWESGQEHKVPALIAVTNMIEQFPTID